LTISLCATLGLVRPLSAEQPMANDNGFPSETYSELLSYVQQLGEEQSTALTSPHNFAPIEDESYSALREFVREIGGGDGQADTKPIVLAQAEQPKAAQPTKAKAVKAMAAVGAGEAAIVGSQVCLGCHADQAAKFAQTLMGKIGKVRKGTMECENCHGPGSLHVKAGGGRGVGGIISFRPDDASRSAKDNNAICLNCHERGDRTYWNGSTHQVRDLMCTNCHTVMRSVSTKYQLRKITEMEVCFQCHKDRRAQLFRTSHMPLREGKVTCSDCHNPHGAFTKGLLRAESINENCYKCHAEKRGPFLFEHAPVRQNCLNCHDPHGSVNEYLLKISRPRLCNECHTMGHGGFLTGGPVQIGAVSRSCQNCHTEVHGTNSPGGALLHR
jgi:DmsE family decaheme c-type cytochrome